MQQSIPQCFLDKIEIDRKINNLLLRDQRPMAVRGKEFQVLKKEQARLRRLCQINVESTPRGSANSA